MYRFFLRYNKGFTAVELLVVLIILGLLTAIGVLSYKGATEYAEQKMVESNLRTIDAAIKMYYEDGKGKTKPLAGDNLFDLLVPDYLEAPISGPGTAYYRISDLVMNDQEFPQAQVVSTDEVGGYVLGMMSFYTLDNLPWNND